MVDFRHFYKEWKDLIRVRTSAELTRNMYFAESRDQFGFDSLPAFIERHGVDWAVLTAGIFELRSALAGRLDSYTMAKFRMIYDRHLLNLSKADFCDEYHSSSDERALFLIHQQVPPVRVCSALTACKNASIDMVLEKSGADFGPDVIGLVSAFSSLYMIEINHVMRAYVYYAQNCSSQDPIFDVVRNGDDEARFDYALPDTNGQMSYPDKSKVGMLEMF